ncbi:MAG TPA: acylglycerol kinase family protein, partial [Pyrinomonadaceae bacterium]
MATRRRGKKSVGGDGGGGAPRRTARFEKAEPEKVEPEKVEPEKIELTKRHLRSHDSSLPLVVVNPTSANGATGRAWPRMASELRSHFGAFAVAFTERAGHAREIAEREARAGRRLLIACGGDGTISEVANGVLASGADAELGLLPSGTGGEPIRIHFGP